MANISHSIRQDKFKIDYFSTGKSNFR